jgi:hypothetical protein
MSPPMFRSHFCSCFSWLGLPCPLLAGAKTDATVLNLLIQKKLPKLHAHLFKNNVHLDIVCLPWSVLLVVLMPVCVFVVIEDP